MASQGKTADLSPNWIDYEPLGSLPSGLWSQRFVFSSLLVGSRDFVSRKSRRVLVNHQGKRRRNIAPTRKRRRKPRPPRPPNRLLRLLHRRLRPKRSGLANKQQLQQQQVQPSHPQLPRRENMQRLALQRLQVLHQNSAWAICSNRGILRQQPVPLLRPRPQRKARPLRLRPKRPHLAGGTAWFGLTQSRMFFTRKARVSTAPRKKANT